MAINENAYVAYIDFEHSDTFGIKHAFVKEVPTEELKDALKEIQEELNKRKGDL